MKGSEYHKLTSYERFRLKRDDSVTGGSPDFFKSYPDVPYIELPGSVNFPKVNFWDVILGRRKSRIFSGASIEAISVLFYLSYGITATDRSGFYAFRSVPSAGALYPCELYGWIGGCSGIEAGLYHYNVREHLLEQIGRIQGTEDFLEFWVSVIPYRSAWKYGSRAFRYVLLDSGHLLEQIRIAAGIMGWKVTMYLGFDDFDRAAQMLCVDDRYESLIGRVVLRPLESDGELLFNADRNYLRERSIPAKGADYGRIIRAVLETTKREKFLQDDGDIEIQQGDVLPVDAVPLIINRRSRRNFVPMQIKKSELEIFFLALSQIRLPEELKLFFAVERVDGIIPGVYRYEGEGGNFKLEPVREGSTIYEIASACLDQMWIGNAAFAIVVMIDHEKVDDDSGDRGSGYRSALLTAGRVGQLTYLVSEAFGYGCCGIGALYDSEVANVVNYPSGFACYVLACGPVKKRL